MTECVFLDTNVLLYSISESEAESGKREIALDLLDREDCALSTQVLLEFYNQATRKSRPDPFTSDQAWGLITSWRRFPIQGQTIELLETAHGLRAQTNYSIWDSLIIAAAQAQGCTILYTEYMQHGRIIDSLRIVNPFREGALVR